MLEPLLWFPSRAFSHQMFHTSDHHRAMVRHNRWANMELILVILLIDVTSSTGSLSPWQLPTSILPDSEFNLQHWPAFNLELECPWGKPDMRLDTEPRDESLKPIPGASLSCGAPTLITGSLIRWRMISGRPMSLATWKRKSNKRIFLKFRRALQANGLNPGLL